MNEASSSSEKALSTFWSTLENIIRPSSLSKQDSTPQSPDSLEKLILPRLNGLRSQEPMHSRLKTFDELINRSELFNFNEKFLNTLLQLTRDMFKIELTPIEFRKPAFEYLIKLYEKQSDKFETFLLKNHLLSFIINNDSTSKCLFLYTLNNLIIDSTDHVDTCTKKILSSNKSPSKDIIIIHKSDPPTINDDVKLRLILFNSVTKNGTNCCHLDPELTTECLIYFLLNAHLLNESSKHLFKLFKNIITQEYFQYIDDNLLFLLTKFILNFSYVITKNLTGTDNAKTIAFNSKQQIEIKNCVELTHQLISHLTTINCVKHVVLSLCELLDLVWLNQSFRNSDLTMTSINENVIAKIYDCMNKLFTSPIGNCSIFTFFTEVFLPRDELAIHRAHQINGGLMHIKKLFDDFRHTKLKNTVLIKELHLNCLIYLPIALESCCSINTIRKAEQLIIFEHILILTIDLVHLATHRDLFMCLLTFKSRKFLIDIVDQFSVQIKDNKQLIQKYAELLNLLDKKDVFNYKTSNCHSTGDEIAVNFQKFKESFYELVYKFPHTYYLTDSCINSCIEYYLQRKLLPYLNTEAIDGIKMLLEKYFLIKQCQNISVRKFVLEAVSKKLHDYNKYDQKMFAEDVIRIALLPLVEKSIDEDNQFYHSLDVQDGSPPTPSIQQFHSDLIEIKYFIVSKLIELSNICVDETNIFKIVEIFERIISLEISSSIDLLNLPMTSIQLNSFKTGVVLSPPSSSNNQNSNFNQNLTYLNKIIQGLIELFERHFSNKGICFTKSCSKIFLILTNYLDKYYNPTVENLSQTTIGTNHQLDSKLNLFQIQNHSKYYNYYAQIRREIFEFLLRIRSDKNNRMLLLNRTDRRKHLVSKYLILNISSTTRQVMIEYADTKNSCLLNFKKILNLVENCLDKELDWNVLIKVLKDLPFVLQYEMNLIKESDFFINIFKYFYKRDIGTLRNRPETLTRPEYICKFYPLIASLVLYHPILERSSQENILQNFAVGISSFRYRFCFETLTIAITEMHETNSKTCAEILLKLSQFSPSQNMAQPVLELLSTISDLKKLDSCVGKSFGFGRKEFIAVSAIAIKYTDPLKFNPFIILLAHYVICIWFIKCKQDFRKNYASFTCKGLYQEVIVQLDRLNKQQNLKDIKSPSRVFSEQETSGNKGLHTVTSSNSLLGDASKEPRTNLSENMKIFYKELVEITLDFMSNNMYFDNALHQQLTPAHNQNEFLVDIYSNAPMTTRSNMIDTAKDLCGNNPSTNGKTGLSRSWIVGNKIVQIKTGLFANICIDDQQANGSRKHRNSNSKSQSKHTDKTQATMAINIPTNKALNLAASTITSTDSYESSEGSNNNSFSSQNLTTTSNLGSISGSAGSGKTNLTFVRSQSEVSGQQQQQQEDNVNINPIAYKSEQELFDETIDSNNESTLNEENNSVFVNNNNQTPEIRSQQPNRRVNLNMKRRYKSGIPFTADHNDDDSIEEIYLRNLHEHGNNKTSKDDSDIILASSVMCGMVKYDADHQIKDRLYHSTSDKITVDDKGQLFPTNNKNSYASSHSSGSSLNKLDNYNNKPLDERTVKEICHPNCWCNNLVEVTCRYPTKVLTYVTLIDSNNCTSHDIDLSGFDKSLVQNKLGINYRDEPKTTKSPSSSSSDTKQFKLEKHINDNQNHTQKTDQQKDMAYSLSAIQASAIELRKIQLSRISESSAMQDIPQQTDDKPETTEQQTQKMSLQRKASFDSKVKPEATKRGDTLNGVLDPDTVERKEKQNKKKELTRTQTEGQTIQLLKQSNQSGLTSSQSPYNIIRQKSQTNGTSAQNTSIDPSQVFLHLFQNHHSNVVINEKDQPMIIPENSSFQRSMNILDFIPCYLIHKIGVIYVGKNQAYDEKAILSNANGSPRYKSFINGLGNLLRLKDLDTNRYYSGGLETDGSAGEFSLLWFDGIIQVVFHVATMMPMQSENNCNSKKKHIGNDSTIIVYNESGEEYQFGMIKGEVNCVCIEIEPLKSNTNVVKVKATNEITQSSWVNLPEQKFVSDLNLAIITRKMALHADLATKCYRFQKDGNGTNPYGGKWYERLKQINRIRKSCKEFYSKQQRSNNDNTANKSGENQLDFTDFI